MERIAYPFLLLAIALPLTLAGCARSTTMTDTGMAGGGVDVVTAPIEAGTSDAERIIGTNTSPSNTIVENARAIPYLSSFFNAVQASGLAETLAGPGPYTVFAPNNEAFDLLDVEDFDAMSPERRDELEQLLRTHVSEGEMTFGELTDGTVVVMLSGDQVGVGRQQTDLLMKRIGGADILIYDVESSNGVIHIVNFVIDPDGVWSQG